jgi:hypothetical protein
VCVFVVVTDRRWMARVIVTQSSDGAKIDLYDHNMPSNWFRTIFETRHPK